MDESDDSVDSDDINALTPSSTPPSSTPRSDALSKIDKSPAYPSLADSHKLGSGSSNCTDEGEMKVVAASPDWTSDNRCSFYPPRSDGCTEPRSCRDCLNIDVRSSSTCLVNQYGRCVRQSPSTYVKSLDFRYQNASNDAKQSNEQRVQFLANTVDYCHVKDTKCQQCRDTVFADVMNGRIDGSLTKFCYGKGGCVCIAVCEASIWQSTIGLTVCNGVVVKKDIDKQYANSYGATTYQGEKGKSSVGIFLIGVVGGVATAVVILAAVFYIRKYRLRNSNLSGSSEEESISTEEGVVPRRVPTAPQLSLFGWQSMRLELIDREQMLLAGVEDFLDVRTGYLQLLDVDASAPPPEEDESSAPVLLLPLAGASAPSLSPRALAMAPSAPPASPTRNI